MSNGQQDRVNINRLPTGVPGLDEILGSGGEGDAFPEYSFNVIAGTPGCGKTTLVHQIMFANATPDRPALYFTVLGEPAFKMLRYQQQYSFFDLAKLEGPRPAIRFINLSHVVLQKDLNAVLAEIVREVETTNPAIVVVDSFRTVVRKTLGAPAGTSHEMELQGFVQRLAIHLATWQATTFLVGEYHESEIRDNPVFTVADGLIWLSQVVERNSVVRKLQVMKMRGTATVPGLHTFRIGDSGLETFPRTLGLSKLPVKIKGQHRVSTGVPGLDEMMGGGIPQGDSLLLAGPSGAGKSILASQFIYEGIRQGEPGVVAVFEEIPKEYIAGAAKFGMDMQKALDKGTLEILYLRPLDLSVDETVYDVINAVKRIGAKRVVIDSLVGFEMALAPGFRADFRESLYRMIGAITRLGVTVVSTVEVEEDFISMGLSNFAISFLADDIIRLRYVSINGQLRRMLIVVKTRRGQHSIDMTEYTITSKGMVIGEPLRGYRGLTSGIPSAQ